MSYNYFISKACGRLKINPNEYTFHYIIQFDSFVFQQLDKDEDMHMMVSLVMIRVVFMYQNRFNE